MGEQKVSELSGERELQQFMRHLLNDVHALEYMLENDWFETGITRIGAEQEMCLVNRNYKPATNAMDILNKLQEYPWQKRNWPSSTSRPISRQENLPGLA